jgi:hypothetical protein
VIQKISLSVPPCLFQTNIAEGFERGTTADLITFLYYSRGSAGESRSILRLCEGQPRFSNFKFEISNLINRGIGISKQLHGWIDSLKNTEIKGVRYYTNKERRRLEVSKEFEEFDREMDRYRQELLEKLMQQEVDASRSRAEEDQTNGAEV